MAISEFVPGRHDSFADMLAEQVTGGEERATETQPSQPKKEGGLKIIAKTDEKGRFVPVVPEGSIAYLRRRSGERRVKIHGPQHLLAGRVNVVFEAPNS